MRLTDCERPENIEGPTVAAWAEINAHLNTSAKNLPELVEQLGQRTFGHTPRVGDSFCGGGSIPFEAARIGCESFGSDLNPVAGLLTWASLNLLGGGKQVQDEVRKAQEQVFAAADKQITEWGIEHNDQGEGLRRWSNDDVMPRPSDVFQERLYCIRWINAQGERRYAAPDAADIAREAKVLELLRERISDWQREGFIPSKAIVSGYNTDQPTRERGWTYWHHLFTPRQLLVHGLISSLAHTKHRLCLPDVGRLANADSRLTMWNWRSVAGRGEAISQTFSNQALNTNFCYAGRGLIYIKPIIFDSTTISDATVLATFDSFKVSCVDARDLRETCDFWITDPPNADAVNYHELADFFLAWYDKQLVKAFPEWIPDARAELAVRGDGEDFRRSMVEIYQNLARHMPDNGMQMVMFTHQDPAVWADLGMILWAAGLKATAAWTISTETSVGIKKGNYVQGTVCLVLRKRTANEPGFLDEVYPLVRGRSKAPDRFQAGARRRWRTQFQRCRLPARRLCGRAQGAHPLRQYRRPRCRT